MPEKPKRFYDFGPFRLDPEKRLLLKGGEPVPLTPKVFDTLLVLVEGSGRVLEKDLLMERLWPDSFVEEGSLAVNISTLRKALGENRGEHLYILTVPGKGYRFVANVREIWVENADLIVEEHTRARFVLEQDEKETTADTDAIVSTVSARPNRLRERSVLISVGSLLLVVAVAVAYLLVLRSRPTQAGIHINSVAILPFRMLSSDANTERMGFAMSETLITRLSNIRRVRVRPTSAVQNYNDINRDCVKIGRELQVDAVVDGSIQKDGDKLRITVRVVSASDGSPVWAKKFDEDFANFFAAQDEVSEQTARALTPSLSPEERQLVTKRDTESREAYDLYILGRYFWNGRQLDKGLEYFLQAIEKDPDYALAWAGLADSYILRGSSGYDTQPGEMIEKARSAASRAIELNGDLAEAHTSLGIIHLQYDWNLAEAESELSRALELKPNYETAQYWYVIYLIAKGQLKEAVEVSRQDEQANPSSLILGVNMARALYYAREFDQAIKQCLLLVNKEPKSFGARFILASAYMQNGNNAEAIAEFTKLSDESKDKMVCQAALGAAYAKAGNRQEAMRIAQQLEERSKTEYVEPSYTATVYAYLGYRDLALERLEKAYKERSSTLVNIQVEPTFDSLRLDPRFRDLARRVVSTP
jgi:DNA-binding winged helix-turn-helix (wHTH) protein/TolB-like protein/Flp pilus assembly protein TadD